MGIGGHEVFSFVIVIVIVIAIEVWNIQIFRRVFSKFTFLLPNGSGILIAMSEWTILLKRGLTVMFGESNGEVEKISLC